MSLTYFKRYRMEVDLIARDCLAVDPPAGYRLLAWDPSLVELHAKAKYRSFCEEIDANVFPCLGELSGCLRLMNEITMKAGFVPEATWLAVYEAADTGQPDYCGTIQGVDAKNGCGSIQNLGVVPEHRGLGLGRCLLNQALSGFRSVGMSRVSLEVTAENVDAIRLYRQEGFTIAKTVFKAADMVYF